LLLLFLDLFKLMRRLGRRRGDHESTRRRQQRIFDEQALRHWLLRCQLLQVDHEVVDVMTLEEGKEAAALIRI